MRSTRNTVGGVFAAITAGISLVMAIWDVDFVDYDNVIRKHFCRKTVFVIFCSVVSREYF